MPNLGATEILIILAIVLLLFGANKLPELARSMGRSARIFKSEVKEMRREDMEDAPVSADDVRPEPIRPSELPPASYSQETRSTMQNQAQNQAQPESFWDRPENQPRR